LVKKNMVYKSTERLSILGNMEVLVSEEKYYLTFEEFSGCALR
jgi:hypothetical protein